MKRNKDCPSHYFSDPEKEVLLAYGVWQEKKNYSKITMGFVRTTYLINEDGVIEKAFRNVKAGDNPALILETLS